MRSVLAREMLFFTSLLLLLSACRLVDGASIVSGEESARLKVHDAGGVLRLGTNNTHDLFKRQTTCATIAPLCAGTGDCCSGICCAIECCIGGATCTGGQCVANAPPSASSASAPQADPSSSAVQSSGLAQSSSEAQSSSTSSSDSSPSSAQASSSLPTPPSSSSPVVDSSTSSAVDSSTSALADPSMSSMSIAPPSSIPGSSSTSIVGADTSTSVSGSQPAAAPSASGSLSATASSTAVSILPLIDYNVTTVSNETGPQVVTFGTFTETSTYAYVPSTTESSSAAPSQEPLVVQQVPPTVTNNPEVQMQYQPTDAWETSGSQGQNGNENGSNGGNDNGSSSVTNRPIPLCNNGTKISNQAGSAIRLTFTGIEASLQMIPSLRGSAYSVQLDDEDPEDFDSFKADANQCQVSIGWTRTNLPNTAHNITVIVKGNTASGGGDPNAVKSLEFNGLTFTGPAPPPAKKGTSKWVIVGVAAGGVVLVAILVILVILIIRRRRQRSETATPINDPRASTVGGSTMGGGRRLTHATSPRSSTYAPSHMRNDSGMSSPPGSIPGSLPGSPSMRPWGLPQTQTPSIHQRQASWVDGGAPFGTTYIPPPPAQPYSIPYNAGGSPPRQAFVPGHSRGPSSMSDNRNPFEG